MQIMLVPFLACLAATWHLGAALDPVSGEGYSIFHPFNEPIDSHHHHSAVLAPPEKFIHHYELKAMMLSRHVNAGNLLDDPQAYARDLYFEALKQFLSGSVFRTKELSVSPAITSGKLKARPLTRDLDDKERAVGHDWTAFGFTMTGEARLKNAYTLLLDIFQNKIEGAVAETGVWRGGMSIFLRAVLRAYHEGDRMSFVCDSFRGLPPTTYKEEHGRKWDNAPYLEVSDEVVKQNFELMGLQDPNVVFVKGFFSASMKPLSESYTGKFSLLRLDGDMYESTVDVLYLLYGRLSVGGYVIMDDWFGFPSKDACLDFFAVHGIQPTIIPIDVYSAYWKKTEEVEIQYWRYEQKKFMKDDVKANLRA